MADTLADDAAAVEQFGPDFDVVVEVLHDRNVGDVHGGHSALVGKRGRPPDYAAGVVAQEFDDDEGAPVRVAFPAPGRAAAVFVRGPVQAQVPEVSLEGPVGLDFDQERKVDHQIDVAGARVRPDAGWRVRDKMARSEPADEVDAALPGAESSEQGDEDPLASLRRVVVVVAVVCGHRGQ